jgi:FkbM family methyltransferase
MMGIKRYLRTFARFKIRTIKKDKKESDFFLFLNEIDKKEGCIIDAGANIGVMSYHLCKAFPDDKIVAFEPLPLNLDIIRYVKKKYALDNLEILPFALGSTKEKMEMVLPKVGGVKMHGLTHMKHESISDFNEGDSIEVDVIKLDDWWEDNKSNVKGIKIDVENFEYFVLKGGHKLIQDNSPLIYLELWENINRDHCFDILASWKYEAYVSEGEKLIPYNKELHSHQNFIFKAKK